MLLKPLIGILIALHLMPAALTQILFCATQYESEKEKLKKRLIPGTLLNLLGNGAFAVLLIAWRFHTRRPWKVLARMLRLECTNREVGTLALTLGICVLGGLLGGFLLRLLFFRKERPAVSRRRKALLLLLCTGCAGFVLAGRSVIRESERGLRITDVYRKASPVSMGLSRAETDRFEGMDISCVTVVNPGSLSCILEEARLTDAEDDPQGVRFQNIEIPARSSLNLLMDFNHGIDVSQKGETTVYLWSGDGTLLDSVRVPALRAEQSYSRADPDGDVWTVISHASASASETRTVQAPVLSAPAGFYDEAFDLTITGPEGARIYYTLDGSDPSAESPEYTGPIRIEDRTETENIWSLRTDVSATFLTQKPRYTIPDFPVDKCTVVRAVCVDERGESSAVTTGSYFIGYARRTGYRNLRVVSIVTDPANLFDEEKGIYVLGNVFRDQCTPEEKARQFFWWWPANYRQKGPAWEREAVIQIFDTDRSLLVSKTMGIRVRGGASAGFLPKGLNLYARKLYDPEPRLNVDLFGTGYMPKRISLSQGGNETVTKAKDWLMTRLAGDLDIAMMHFEPCCVFLEGEYWGVYWLTEQLDEEYFQYYYGVEKGSLVSYKNGRIKSGAPEQIEQVQKAFNYISDHDMRDPSCYARAGKLMDLENLTLYFALEIYVGNKDWTPVSNIMLWRTSSSREEAYGDGRWRFVLFDVNSPYVYQDSREDHVAWAKEQFPFFRSLMENEDFSRHFYETLRKLAEETFAPERTEQAISEYRQQMKPALNANHLRFYNKKGSMKRLDEYQQFFAERAAYISEICERELTKEGN